MVGEVDESETGSAIFLVRKRSPGARDVRPGRDGAPRPPAFSPGFHAFAWGVVLGAYVWIGLLAIGTGGGSAFLFGLVAAVLIFVRLCGDDQLRRD